MKNAWKVLTLSVGVLVLTGCANVVGKWALDSITPEEARGHYKLAHVALNKDGTYAAAAKKGDETVKSAGTYTFGEGKLTFTSDAGKVRAYNARLVDFGTKMEVKATVDDQEVTAIMKRHTCKKCKCDKHKAAEKHE